MISIFDNHSAYNKWLTLGNKVASGNAVASYTQTKSYTKQLKERTSESIREMIVEDINSIKNVRLIGLSNIDAMIDELNTVKEHTYKTFKELYAEDLFKAFRFLHSLKYGRTTKI